MKHRAGPWIQLWSGRQFWPFDPRAEDIEPDDLAMQLSRLNRFIGATVDETYSVAQHSVLVASFLPPSLKLWGLLHDAAEALGLGDIPGPVKADPRLEQVQLIETAILRATAARFCLTWPMPLEVKIADEMALATEREQLMAQSAADWSLTYKPQRGVTIRYMSWREARAQWLSQFWELQP